MKQLFHRRSFLATASSGAAVGFLGTGTLSSAIRVAAQSTEDVVGSYDSFPSQDPRLVRETVGVSHGNFARVKELVTASPALAKASVDWGFGDWESALGAASHTGRGDIAEFLIENGARPNLFTAAMMGRIGLVKMFVRESPGVQRIPGPHGITLLSHAKAGSEAASEVYAYLESLGDADLRPKTVPLTDEERRSYLGHYSYGAGDTEKLEVYERRGFLTIRRKDGSGRGLSYLGNHAFRPAGASAVRIRFAFEGGRAVNVSVHDPDVIVSARRTGE